jgi:ParB/RepB/Spo0J family partition protein
LNVASWNPKPKKWKLSKLKPHPRQDEIFGEMNDAELRELADDMNRRGLQHPIEILPEGTIIAGHQRFRAAQRLGWEEIDVIVRSDLAEAGAAAVEQHFLRDNLVRRQLSPLARARCIAQLMEDKSAWGREELKAKVGELINLDPRSVSRYLRLLTTPIAVQNATDRGDLSLTDAGRLAGLDGDEQQEIAQRIEAGESAKTVIADYLEKKDRRHRNAGDAVATPVRLLERCVQDLDGRHHKATPRFLHDHLDGLEKMHEILGEWISKGRNPSPPRKLEIPDGAGNQRGSRRAHQ